MVVSAILIKNERFLSHTIFRKLRPKISCSSAIKNSIVVSRKILSQTPFEKQVKQFIVCIMFANLQFVTHYTALAMEFKAVFSFRIGFPLGLNQHSALERIT